MDIQAKCLLAAEGAFLIHSLIKADSIKKKFDLANLPFSFKRDYLGRDYLGILASFLIPGLWLLLFGEVAVAYPKIEAYSICSFALIGGAGSYFFQMILSRATKYVNKITDIKTNIADGIDEPPTITRQGPLPTSAPKDAELQNKR